MDIEALKQERDDALNRLEICRGEIRRLFDLLDNIDTAEDAFHPETIKIPAQNARWASYVHKQQRKRFDGITSTDGYEIFIDDTPSR